MRRVTRAFTNAVSITFSILLAGCASDVAGAGPSDGDGAQPAAPAPTAAAAPAPAAKLLPASVDFTMPNGIRVFLVPDHEVPLVDFVLRVAGGTVEDPAGREGAAALLASLLTKGAGPRDTAAFREEVEVVGGVLDAGAAPRWISVSAQFLKGDVDLALELLGDVVMRPRLAAEEFAKEKGQAIDGLAAAREEPASLIGRYWARWIFGAHPFARPWSGDEASLEALTLDDVRAVAARQLAPQRAWLAVAGDFDPPEMRRKLEARFAGWKAPPGSSAATPVGAWKATEGGRVLLVDKPDALQTYFILGNGGFDRRDPDHAARSVANCTLGERFTSRLNKVLRTEKGFTYGAFSRFDDARQGLFTISTQGTANGTTAECVPLAEGIYRAFLDGGLTAGDLASTKAFLRGQFGLGFETGAQQAAAILDLEFDGLSRDVVDTFLARVDAITLDEVNRVIRERFPRKLDWTAIGRADVCRPVFAKFGAVTECKVTDPGFGPPAR